MEVFAKKFWRSPVRDKLLKLSNLIDNNNMYSFHRRIISNYDNLEDLLLLPTQQKIEYDDDDFLPEVNDEVLKMQILDFLNYLPDDILVKVDRASMNSSLEVRVPFLDNSVIDHAFNLKSDQKVKNNSGKIILKKILSKFLPEKLIDRPKMGFGIPSIKL